MLNIHLTRSGRYIVGLLFTLCILVVFGVYWLSVQEQTRQDIPLDLSLKNLPREQRVVYHDTDVHVLPVTNVQPKFLTYRNEQWKFEITYPSEYQEGFMNSQNSIVFTKPLPDHRAYEFFVTVSDRSLGTFKERFDEAKKFRQEVESGAIEGPGAILYDLPYKEDIVLFGDVSAEKIFERSALLVDSTSWITYLFQRNNRYFKIEFSSYNKPDAVSMAQFQTFVRSLKIIE